MSEQKFYLCETCKNLVGMIRSSGVPMVCCQKKMSALTPSVTDAGAEKHLPLAEICDTCITVTVGDVAHPMTEEHSIEWVYLQTDAGGMRKCLKAGDAPTLTFALSEGEKPLNVYAYCNLHGLWKREL